MAYDVTVEKEINKSRAEVFNALMDFGGVKALLPDMVAKCDCTGNGVGAVREIELADGGRVVDARSVRLTALEPEEKSALASSLNAMAVLMRSFMILMWLIAEPLWLIAQPLWLIS